jgi:hypothetical protein
VIDFEVRGSWKNHLGNQTIDPLRIYEPATIADVVSIVQLAEQEGVTARAVGSGHSWSDVALTEGFLMKTNRLARAPAPEPDFIRGDWSGRRLVRVEAGIRLKELNDFLDGRGLGLTNMGGYDHQTLAGVISTSTHGSGIEHGPLNDMVRSLDLVTAGGVVRRVERADGPTDRAAFQAHHGERRILVQDDHVFDAVAVGIGCMGIVCTAMLEVREKYFLREVREMHPWAKVRADLEAGAVFAENRHYELIFSPYADQGKVAYPCLVTTRNITEDPRNKAWHKRMRNWLVEAAAAFPLTPHIINLTMDVRPNFTPTLLEGSIKALVKAEYDEVSYKVFNIGLANILPAYSAEIGVPMDGRHIEAVERIFEIAAERRRLGSVYQNSPIALRFVKASPAYMSMMHGRDTMMIELIGLAGNDGGFPLLNAYEEALYDLGGRPHWGQVNTLSASDGFVASMYPRYDDWQGCIASSTRATYSTARSLSASGSRRTGSSARSSA